MKTIYKWLNPAFLRRWNDWLIERNPLVWRTRIHYVLYWSLLAAALLFVLGLLYPVSAMNLTIDPVKPIVMGLETYYIAPLILCSLGMAYWAYTQYQAGFPAHRLKSVMLSLALYALGIWVIAAVTAPAFYMGLLVRTAYFFMDQKDIDLWEANDYYLYGFVLRDADSVYVEPDADFFRAREADFKQLWEVEQSILSNRYHQSIVDNILDQLDWLDRSSRLYRSCRSYRRSERSSGSNWSNWFHLSGGRSDFSERPPPSDREYLSNLSYRSYRSDWADMSYMSYISERSERFYSDGSERFLMQYAAYYEQYRGKAPELVLEKYRIAYQRDTIELSHITFIRLHHLHLMEDAIRSVQHARQYLRADILLRWHGKAMLCYALLVALLLFAVPYLSLRMILGVVAVIGIGSFVLFEMLHMDASISVSATHRNAIGYLFWPLLGFVTLLCLFLFKFNRVSLTLVAFHLVMLGIGVVLSFSMREELYNTNNHPTDLAFFGVQAIGVAAVVLMARLQTLPKRG